jgi:hypothetical protein
MKRADFAIAEAQQTGEHLVGLLAEQRRGANATRRTPRDVGC